MGGNVSKGSDNDELVDNLLKDRYLKTASIQQVFRAVDRGLYFTKDSRKYAYNDTAWRSGNIHLSAPGVYCEVMENLQLGAGMSFLNLGSGTGYLNTMAGLFLGSYGLNYGVEVNKDVVQFAYKRLEKFKWTAEAIDEYDFCEPRFFEGNCLQLSSENRLYDRVYCGAACPPNLENYMKNLIKVGGVLVMPLEDVLLKVIRTSETTWEKISITPVNFANMILPSPCDTNPPQLLLANPEPLSLQVLCRTAIRETLRRIVREEHPKLKTHRIRKPILLLCQDTFGCDDFEGALHRNPAIRMLLFNKLGLPFFSTVGVPGRMDQDGSGSSGSSSGSSSSSSSDGDEEEEEEEEPMDGHEDDEDDASSERIQVGMKRKKAHQKNTWSDSGTDMEEMQGSSPEGGNKTVNGKKWNDDGQGLKLNCSMKSGKGGRLAGGATCVTNDDERDMCELVQGYNGRLQHVDDLMLDRQKFVANLRMGKKKGKARGSHDAATDSDQEGGNREEPPEPPTVYPSYSILVRDKIRALPLPPTIQSYLNFHRTF